ncbi:MAG TPA: signal peptidase II [Chryseolinea sp.]|nr:signal peptidase II [Chryseolinea sp.]
MAGNRVTRLLLITVILVCNFGCDQLSKRIVRKNVDDYEEIAIVKGHLTLTKVENKGAFLSLGHALPQQLKTILLAVLPLLALGVAVIYLLINDRITYLRAAGICFLVGGGLGNIMDRLFYGSVTDFLHLQYGRFQTGIFNLADVSIVIGLILILVSSYSRRTRPNYNE